MPIDIYLADLTHNGSGLMGVVKPMQRLGSIQRLFRKATSRRKEDACF